MFESNLIKYLRDRNYPCPAPLRNKHGKFVGIYNRKPFLLFEFAEGRHVENPNENQKNQLIKKVAELHNITKNYRPINKKYRWNYSVELCRELARIESKRINSENSRRKLEWFETELLKLKLPKSLPKGICHCDFHFSNVLFQGDKFSALLNFDDANYTFLMFDLVGLIESRAWQRDEDNELSFEEARKVLSEYAKHRCLNHNEKRHLFDLYKLSILFDCVWYFERGNTKDFKEKRKIEYLANLGREKFYQEIYSAV